MNWRLIFTLSLFGLAMAFATVFFIPDNIEPFCWLAIFLVCAYIIATNCSSKYFFHGFMVSVFNSVWITAAHIFFFDEYIAGHAREAAMMKNMPGNPKLMMLGMGPLIGVASGLVLGLLAFVASRIIKRKV